MKLRVSIPLLVALTLIPAVCVAETVLKPTKYTKITRNQKYTFMMIPHAFPRPRRTSGLYRRGDLSRPLWTVDWYAFDVDVASDGEHVVRWGPWPVLTDNHHSIGVAFYRKGKKIRYYTVAELAKDAAGLRTTELDSAWVKRTGFDDVGGRVSIEIYRGGYSQPSARCVFDIRTGGITNTRMIPPVHIQVSPAGPPPR